MRSREKPQGFRWEVMHFSKQVCISLQRGDIDVSPSHMDFLHFFDFFECTTRFARFFRLCLSKSNQIRLEQQRPDQATSEQPRIAWSSAKQYRNNLTSLNVSYALRDTVYKWFTMDNTMKPREVQSISAQRIEAYNKPVQTKRA